MTKGNLISVALVVVAVYRVGTGNWGSALFAAVIVQIGLIAAMMIERRSQPPIAVPQPLVSRQDPRLLTRGVLSATAQRSPQDRGQERPRLYAASTPRG